MTKDFTSNWQIMWRRDSLDDKKHVEIQTKLLGVLRAFSLPSPSVFRLDQRFPNSPPLGELGTPETNLQSLSTPAVLLNSPLITDLLFTPCGTAWLL